MTGLSVISTGFNYITHTNSPIPIQDNFAQPSTDGQFNSAQSNPTAQWARSKSSHFDSIQLKQWHNLEIFFKIWWNKRYRQNDEETLTSLSSTSNQDCRVYPRENLDFGVCRAEIGRCWPVWNLSTTNFQHNNIINIFRRNHFGDYVRPKRRRFRRLTGSWIRPIDNCSSRLRPPRTKRYRRNISILCPIERVDSSVPMFIKILKNLRWFRPRRAVGFDCASGAIESNCTSTLKSSWIFQNFHEYRDGTVHTPWNRV